MIKILKSLLCRVIGHYRWRDARSLYHDKKTYDISVCRLTWHILEVHNCSRCAKTQFACFHYRWIDRTIFIRSSKTDTKFANDLILGLKDDRSA